MTRWAPASLAAVAFVRRVVTVTPRRFTSIRVDYDSGIRFVGRGLR
jgi:hypothetical protein